MFKTTFGFYLLLGTILFASNVNSATPSPALDELLAEHNFRLGAEVELLADFQIKDREYVDGMHLIVPDGSSRSYLLTFTNRCKGLQGNRIIVRPKKAHQLVSNDRFIIKHNQHTVDHCVIATINELEPISPTEGSSPPD